MQDIQAGQEQELAAQRRELEADVLAMSEAEAPGGGKAEATRKLLAALGALPDAEALEPPPREAESAAASGSSAGAASENVPPDGGAELTLRLQIAWLAVLELIKQNGARLRAQRGEPPAADGDELLLAFFAQIGGEILSFAISTGLIVWGALTLADGVRALLDGGPAPLGGLPELLLGGSSGALVPGNAAPLLRLLESLTARGGGSGGLPPG